MTVNVHMQVTVFAPNAAQQSSADIALPEADILAAQRIGGCGCKGGCNDRRCQKCMANNQPCTFKCKCKGRCTNPFNTNMPLPENISAEELSELPLSDIIPRLTVRDLEHFAVVHGTIQFYCTQFMLCPEDDPCWYCEKMAAERGRKIKVCANSIVWRGPTRSIPAHLACFLHCSIVLAVSCAIPQHLPTDYPMPFAILQ